MLAQVCWGSTVLQRRRASWPPMWSARCEVCSAAAATAHRFASFPSILCKPESYEALTVGSWPGTAYTCKNASFALGLSRTLSLRTTGNLLVQVSGLRELARLALAGDAIASQLLTPEMLTSLLVSTEYGP